MKKSLKDASLASLDLVLTVLAVEGVAISDAISDARPPKNHRGCEHPLYPFCLIIPPLRVTWLELPLRVIIFEYRPLQRSIS